MKIIDSHTHLDDCRISELDYSENDILDARGDGIYKIILQNFSYIRDRIKGHKRIANISKEYPEKIFYKVAEKVFKI